MTIHDLSPHLPRTRGECPRGPCHHVTCRHHLWTERRLDREGAVIDLVETPAWGDPDHTCALHEAAAGPRTLQAVAGIFGVSRERVRQIEEEALARLRDADTGHLRSLLDAVDGMTCEGGPWQDGDSGTPDDRPGGANPETVNDTGVPEGVDEPITDDTGQLPWREPTLTGVERIEAFKSALGRLRRARERAAASRPYWCPHCGRDYPGVSITGRARRGCPNPRCAGKDWAAKARHQGGPARGLAPEVVATIHREYRPGVRGYRSIARDLGLPVGTVAKIARGDRRAGG